MLVTATFVSDGLSRSVACTFRARTSAHAQSLAEAELRQLEDRYRRRFWLRSLVEEGLPRRALEVDETFGLSGR